MPAMTEAVITKSAELLRKLKHDDYHDFIHPFLKHPPEIKFVDIAWIESNLMAGNFNSVEEFVTTIRQMFMHMALNYDKSSEIVRCAQKGLDVFNSLVRQYSDTQQHLIIENWRAQMSQENEHKIEGIYQLLMKDCEAQKSQNTNERKLLQLDKRLNELEKQYSLYKLQTTATIDKLRKRISYLK